MRVFCIAAMAASLIYSPIALAQPAGPLAPGKPAGVHAARHGANTGLLIMGAIGVAVIVGVVALSGNSNGNAGLVNITGPSTTS